MQRFYISLTATTDLRGSVVVHRRFGMSELESSFPETQSPPVGWCRTQSATCIQPTSSGDNFFYWMTKSYKSNKHWGELQQLELKKQVDMWWSSCLSAEKTSFLSGWIPPLYSLCSKLSSTRTKIVILWSLCLSLCLTRKMLMFVLRSRCPRINLIIVVISDVTIPFFFFPITIPIPGLCVSASNATLLDINSSLLYKQNLPEAEQCNWRRRSGKEQKCTKGRKRTKTVIMVVNWSVTISFCFFPITIPIPGLCLYLLSNTTLTHMTSASSLLYKQNATEEEEVRKEEDVQSDFWEKKTSRFVWLKLL